jgi:hypothetical protein
VVIVAALDLKIRDVNRLPRRQMHVGGNEMTVEATKGMGDQTCPHQ